MDITELLKKPESFTVDYKEDFPKDLIKENRDINWEKAKTILIKDIVCIANSIIDTEGYLIYGIIDHKTHREIKGIDKTWDDALFQQWLPSYVYPIVIFEYFEQIEYSNTIGIFKILSSSEYPHVFINDSKGIFHKGQIWFRKGSSNKIALYKDITRMFNGIEPYKINRINDNPILKEISKYYKSLEKKIVLKKFTEKDTAIYNGFKIAYYPNTRKELWVVTLEGQPDLIAMVKP